IVAMEGQVGTVVYAASIGGINAMTLPLARVFARFGVRAMAITPGLFETPLFSNAKGPMVDWMHRPVEFPARTGATVGFAQAVSSIVENRMFNGTVLRIDGAMRVPPGRREWWGS